MDSVTQFVLGSALGVAVMGRRQAVWKSALAGGIVGTLPDLDVLIQFDDPISSMVRHRGETHSIYWQTITAPAIALVCWLLSRRLGGFVRWWVMVWLVLLTHAGLDAMTVYGTQLLLPRDRTPYGVGSIFIIDPLYTLPLLFGLIMALVMRGRSGRHWNLLGLVLSSAYLFWSWQAQQHVTRLVMQSQAGLGLSAGQILVTPTPFNTVLWRIVLRRDDHYEEGFHSLLDAWVEPGRPIRFHRFELDQALDRATADMVSADQIRQFTKGFYQVYAVDQSIRIADLRMGQAPYYRFSFEFARSQGDTLTAVKPVATGSRNNDIDMGRSLTWLVARLRGQDIDPPR